MSLDTLLSDDTIDRMRQQDNRRRVRGVDIVLPREFGFCGGVHRALQIVEKTLEMRHGQRVWLLGELIHNERVNRYFSERGVQVIPEGEFDQLFRKLKPGDALVIPAFGIPADVEQALYHRYGNSIQIHDATCVYVRRVWDFVRDMAAQHRTVIIHGKPGHAEVRAILSRSVTPGNAAVLVPDVDHARELAGAIASGTVQGSYPPELVLNPSAFSPRHVALANQTTMLKSETQRIQRILQQALPDSPEASLQCMDTLCSATQTRQDAATELCQQGCNVVLVLGSQNSSNTSQLYRIAAQYTTRTYFVSHAEAFDADSIRHYNVGEQRFCLTHQWLPQPLRRVGILAGASCPVDIVGNVVRRLETILHSTRDPCVGGRPVRRGHG